MGWITNRRLKSGNGIAHKSKVGNRSGALRKIVGSGVFNGLVYEKLECGHKGKLLSSVGTGGLFGTQVAEKRRCKECI